MSFPIDVSSIRNIKVYQVILPMGNPSEPWWLELYLRLGETAAN